MDRPSPLVTVVLPTFNRRNLLPAAIRSICGQSFRDWRLLVVNDGGEDVSDIVASFADSRIECHDRPHLGKAAALNHGLSLVRSKYVAYMDDDDLVLPDHLAELVAAAEREKAEFVYSDTWLVVLGPDGAETDRHVENDKDASFEDLRLFNRINHKQILHTKRLADEVGPYDERLRILIDYDYIRRLARAARPFHVRKTTGEHILRRASDNPADFASITGLWVSDPAACGRSIATIFADDPAAVASIYRDANALSFVKAHLDDVRAGWAKTRAQLADTRAQLEQNRSELAKTRAELGNELAKTRAELALRTKDLEIVRASVAFRIGRLATAPLRAVRAFLSLLRRGRK
jgi:glycosyltransferase involved in cell wall biosynthesis